MFYSCYSKIYKGLTFSGHSVYSHMQFVLGTRWRLWLRPSNLPITDCQCIQQGYDRHNAPNSTVNAAAGSRVVTRHTAGASPRCNTKSRWLPALFDDRPGGPALQCDLQSLVVCSVGWD